MLASGFFTQKRLNEMRDEIRSEGFVADKFLAGQPDCAVFGLNLACLFPFPPNAREAYETLSMQLRSIDAGVYVYPFWETHVTIATFVNFTQHLSPTPQRITELKRFMAQLATLWGNAFKDIKPFDLWIEQPVISRKAAVLPLSDPHGAVSRIRSLVIENLARDPSLQNNLASLGLNIPPLVHSTIMRFTVVPEDTEQFLSKFDTIALSVPRTAMRVEEICITTETKPYMREGEIVHRFRLGN